MDQHVLSIDDALAKTGGDGCNIFIFGAAELIYFEAEPPKQRYISKVTSRLKIKH